MKHADKTHTDTLTHTHADKNKIHRITSPFVPQWYRNCGSCNAASLTWRHAEQRQERRRNGYKENKRTNQASGRDRAHADNKATGARWAAHATGSHWAVPKRFAPTKCGDFQHWNAAPGSRSMGQLPLEHCISLSNPLLPNLRRLLSVAFETDAAVVFCLFSLSKFSHSPAGRTNRRASEYAFDDASMLPVTLCNIDPRVNVKSPLTSKDRPTTISLKPTRGSVLVFSNDIAS